MGLTNDLTLACDEQNRSSLTRIFLAAACGITSFTAGALQDFTAVVMESTSDVFFEYEFEFETKDFNMEGTNENGTATFTNTVQGKVLGIDKTKGKRFQDVIDERKIVAIIELPNSTGTNKRALVVGWDNIIGRDASAKPNVNGAVEAAIDGDNSLTLILNAKHAEIVREFIGSINLSVGTESFGT